MNDNKITMVVEFSQEELAVRIIEGMGGVRRPDGVTAKQVLDNFTDQGTVDSAMDAAVRVMEYITECMNDAERVTVQ